MGSYTVNGLFYKPAYGESGETNKNKFDDALDSADTTIHTIQTNVNNGVVPRMTTTEIQAIATAGNATAVRIIFNTVRDSLELWVGHGFVRPL